MALPGAGGGVVLQATAAPTRHLQGLSGARFHEFKYQLHHVLALSHCVTLGVLLNPVVLHFPGV